MSPARVREVQLDRQRELFSFEAIDFVLHGVAGSLITEAIEPMLSAQLFSYRKGRSSWQAIRQFAEYVAAAPRRRERPARARHLRLSRRHSQLHGLHRARRGRAHLADAQARLGRERLFAAMEPGGADGAASHRAGRRVASPRGLAGCPWALPSRRPSPTSTCTSSTRRSIPYPKRSMRASATTFCLRIAIPRWSRRLAATIDAHLLRHDLELNAAQAKAPVLQRRGAAVAFLGRGPWARATSSFSAPRFASTERSRCPARSGAPSCARFARAVTRSGKLLRGSPIDERAAALCAIVSESVDPRSSFAEPHAARMRDLVTNREQLAHFDYLIAKMIAEALLPGRGVRAFRQFPPRVLRRRFGLPSLAFIRNAKDP